MEVNRGALRNHQQVTKTSDAGVAANQGGLVREAVVRRKHTILGEKLARPSFCSGGLFGEGAIVC
jgi:hypothetical protein